jgi:hypothetical protein
MMSARDLITGPVREAARKHRPLELDYELEINGCFTWPVLIEYEREPGTRQVADCPETSPSAQILAIRDRVSGKDVLGVLPAELVSALTDDLARGI